MRLHMTPSPPYTHIYLFRYTRTHFSSLLVALIFLDDFPLYERWEEKKGSDKAIQHGARDGERL